MRLQPLPGVRSGWSLEPFSNGRPRKMIVASIRGRVAQAVRDTTGSTEPGLRQSFRHSFRNEHRVVPADFDLGSRRDSPVFYGHYIDIPVAQEKGKATLTAPHTATAAILDKSIVQRHHTPLQRYPLSSPERRGYRCKGGYCEFNRSSCRLTCVGYSCNDALAPLTDCKADFTSISP